MTLPFYAEILSNIQVLRATVATDDTIDASLFVVKNNKLWIEETLLVDLSSHDIQVDPRSLQVQPDNDNSGSQSKLYQVKLSIRSSGKTNLPLEDNTYWPAKWLTNHGWQQLRCRHCDLGVVTNRVDHTMDSTTDANINEQLTFKCKELPSEHWYELVECWICHETKPEEHQARMRPILAQPGTLLVGSFYFLVHAKNLIPETIRVDEEVANKVNWDRGTMTKWISMNCQQCGKVIGEGHYERQQDESLNMMAVKLYKYCLKVDFTSPCTGGLPSFINFFVVDLVDAAKVHATHKFIIQGKKSSHIFALIWLFNWDTTFVYNHGFMDDLNELPDKLTCQRGMKILYADTKEDSDLVKKWKNDKATDHLIYPDPYCQQIVKSLQSSTELLPTSMRSLNHPAMPLTKNFSVGFLCRQ